MKTNLFALLLLVSASAANAAYISFSPSSLSIPRGGVSQEITIRVSGDSTLIPYSDRAAFVETRLSIPLTQLDFVEMTPSPGNAQCVIINGKLFVEYAAANLAPLTVAVNSMCKFRLRARIAAVPGNYAMSQSETYGYNFIGNVLPYNVVVQTATVAITP